MTCQLKMVNVCAWNMQTSNKTIIITCTNGIKKPILLGSYGKYNTKYYDKSKEIQKSFCSSKQNISQTSGHNSFEDVCKVRIIAIVTYSELPNQTVTPGSNEP